MRAATAISNDVRAVESDDVATVAEMLKVLREVVLPSGPPLWPMWRTPNDHVQTSARSTGQTR